jgi:hypothetical protein
MLLVRYAGEHAASKELRGLSTSGAHVELIFEAPRQGRVRVVSPTQGVDAMAKSDIVSWGAFGLVLGFLVGLFNDGGLLGGLDAGIVKGLAWAAFGLAAGALYGLWAGRAASSRRGETSASASAARHIDGSRLDRRLRPARAREADAVFLAAPDAGVPSVRLGRSAAERMIGSARATRREDGMDPFVITLRGEAGPVVTGAFAEFEISVEPNMTVLKGELPDQAALHGVLDRIKDLGIEIIEVRREGTTDFSMRTSRSEVTRGRARTPGAGRAISG